VKRAARILGITFATGLGLAALVWVGTFFYWHFRITEAVRCLESASTEKDTFEHVLLCKKAFAILEGAGCRSLPYLVNAMDPSRSEWLLITLEQRIEIHRRPADWSIEDFLLESQEPREPQGPPGIAWGDSPKVRRIKCEQRRAWWKESGGGYHQWWRIWSPCCRGPKERP
jgi:hypothetical protein